MNRTQFSEEELKKLSKLPMKISRSYRQDHIDYANNKFADWMNGVDPNDRGDFVILKRMAEDMRKQWKKINRKKGARKKSFDKIAYSGFAYNLGKCYDPVLPAIINCNKNMQAAMKWYDECINIGGHPAACLRKHSMLFRLGKLVFTSARDNLLKGQRIAVGMLIKLYGGDQEIYPNKPDHPIKATRAQIIEISSSLEKMTLELGLYWSKLNSNGMIRVLGQVFNEKKAFKQFELGKHWGLGGCVSYLANYYMVGKIVEKDDHIFYEYSRYAASCEDSHGYFNLAQCCMEKIGGCEKNFRLAIRYARRAKAIHQKGVRTKFSIFDSSNQLLCEEDTKFMIRQCDMLIEKANRLKQIQLLSQKEEKVVLYSCAFCNKSDDDNIRFQRCSNCRAVRYCNRKCQVSHWKVHKVTCIKEKEHAITEFVVCTNLEKSGVDSTRWVVQFTEKVETVETQLGLSFFLFSGLQILKILRSDRKFVKSRIHDRVTSDLIKPPVQYRDWKEFTECPRCHKSCKSGMLIGDVMIRTALPGTFDPNAPDQTNHIKQYVRWMPRLMHMECLKVILGVVKYPWQSIKRRKSLYMAWADEMYPDAERTSTQIFEKSHSTVMTKKKGFKLSNCV